MHEKLIQNIELTEYLDDLFGAEHIDFINATPEPNTIRVNTLKYDTARFEEFLSRNNQSVRRLPWTGLGYVPDPAAPPLSHTLLFHGGKIQYQGAASQLPALILNPRPGERVLDLAAAPGSKSTQMAALMENRGELVLNDATRGRLQALNANIQRAGALNTWTLNVEGDRIGALFPEYFDKILLDAPCTALGTVNSSPELIAWWSLGKLSKLARVQYHLLVSALKALKPGGELVYSTCSPAPEENEQVIQQISGKYPVEILPVPKYLANEFDRGLTRYRDEEFVPEMQNALRIYPHRHGLEGFFAIRLRKTSSLKTVKDRDVPEQRATFAASDDAVKEILASISAYWEIPLEFWQNYRYLLTRKRIWMTAADIMSVRELKFVSAGLLLAERRIFGWRVMNPAAQFMQENISGRRIQLDDASLTQLFAQGELSPVDFADGYYVLEHECEVLSIVYVEAGQMRINLPHKFKLQLG